MVERRACVAAAAQRHFVIQPKRTLRTLANAILDLAAFLELSGDDVVDPDAAVNAMESLAFALRSATPEEIDAIRSTIQEQLASSPSPERTDFLQSFDENVGLPQSGAV